MVTVKSSQKIFTDDEVATLTGICVEHLHNFARRRHLGFMRGRGRRQTGRSVAIYAVRPHGSRYALSEVQPL